MVAINTPLADRSLLVYIKRKKNPRLGIAPMLIILGAIRCNQMLCNDLSANTKG